MGWQSWYGGGRGAKIRQDGLTNMFSRIMFVRSFGWNEKPAMASDFRRGCSRLPASGPSTDYLDDLVKVIKFFTLSY